MKEVRSLLLPFADTCRRHKQTLILVLAFSVAIIGCVVLILCLPPEGGNAHAAEATGPDTPAAGSGAASEADAELNRRMNEIYDYLVQLDGMVTDNQSTLEAVRDQADADLAEGESVSAVQEQLQGDVVNLGTLIGSLHDESTAARECLAGIQETITHGKPMTDEETKTAFAALTKQIESIGKDMDGTVTDVEKLVKELQGDDEVRHKAVIDGLTGVKDSMEKAQTKNLDSLKKDLEELQQGYREAIERLQEKLGGKFYELGKDVSAVSGSVKDVKEDVSAVSGSVKAVKEDVSAVSGNVKDVKDGMTQVNGSVEQVARDVSAVSGGVERVGQSVTTVGDKVNSVSDTVATVNGKVEQVGADLSAVSGKMDSLNSGVGELGTSLGASLTSLNEKTGGLQTQLDTMSSQFSAMNGRIDELFHSVSSDKEKLVAALLTLNIPVSSTMTWDELKAAIEGANLNVTIGPDNLPANASYRYHVHSGESRSVISDAVEGPEDHATMPEVIDNLTEADPAWCAGCFQEPIYHRHDNRCPMSRVVTSASYFGDEWTTFSERGECIRCCAGPVTTGRLSTTITITTTTTAPDGTQSRSSRNVPFYADMYSVGLRAGSICYACAYQMLEAEIASYRSESSSYACNMEGKIVGYRENCPYTKGQIVQAIFSYPEP